MSEYKLCLTTHRVLLLQSSDGTRRGFLGLKVGSETVLAIFFRTSESEDTPVRAVLSPLFYLNKSAENLHWYSECKESQRRTMRIVHQAGNLGL